MNLTPEQVNEFIANAVLKSTIGVEVEKAVTKAVQSLSSSYNNPFESVIRNEVARVMVATIRDKYTGTIEAIVAEQIKSQVTEKVVAKIVEVALERAMRFES